MGWAGWGLLPLAFAAASASGQVVPDRVDQVLVYDQGDCPASTDDTIVSCVVITGESPYRVPSALRPGPPTRRDESPALAAVELLRPTFGQGSCSAAGPGAMYGCSGLAYSEWKKAKGGGEGAYYSDLIAKARAQRLADGTEPSVVVVESAPAD